MRQGGVAGGAARAPATVDGEKNEPAVPASSSTPPATEPRIDVALATSRRARSLSTRTQSPRPRPVTSALSVTERATHCTSSSCWRNYQLEPKSQDSLSLSPSYIFSNSRVSCVRSQPTYPQHAADSRQLRLLMAQARPPGAAAGRRRGSQGACSRRRCSRRRRRGARAARARGRRGAPRPRA